MKKRQIAWWQRWLSHVVEVPIKSTGSGVNEALFVSLVRNRLQLSTHKSIYSFDDLYSNFYESFQMIDLPPDGTEILILGLGLGSIPYMLEHHFDRAYKYVAVELDEAVVDLASTFSLGRLESPMQIFQADAEVFVKSHDRQYDLVLVDLFIEDLVPTFFEESEGNEYLKNLLNPGGLLLFNRLYRTGRDKKDTDQFYENVFSRTFLQTEFIEVEGNRVLIGRA